VKKVKKIFKLEGLLIFVILYFIVFGAIDIIRLQREKSQKSAEFYKLQTQYEQQRKINNQLEARVAASSGPEFVEQQARELGYAFPDDHIFVDGTGNF
jgi:cell division protein FtsL